MERLDQEVDPLLWQELTDEQQHRSCHVFSEVRKRCGVRFHFGNPAEVRDWRDDARDLEAHRAQLVS